MEDGPVNDRPELVKDYNMVKAILYGASIVLLFRLWFASDYAYTVALIELCAVGVGALLYQGVKR
jgi:hypothetical protein